MLLLLIKIFIFKLKNINKFYLGNFILWKEILYFSCSVIIRE